MKTIKLFGIMSIVTFSLIACNTVDGVGEDVSATGQVISSTAAEVQSDLN